MNPSNKKPLMPVPSVKLPVAPPVYRPQPQPRCLQTKLAPGVKPNSAPAQRSPIAPPVFRPQQTTRVAQPFPLPAPIVRRQATPPLSQLSPAIIQRAEKKKTKEEEKKERRDARYTRIIRIDQLSRSNIGIRTTRKSERSLRRNLPLEFNATGKHTTRIQGLYSFMRRYGGAGIQGVHRGGASIPRAEVVHGVLSKMAGHHSRRPGRRGPKFAMIGIDPARLDANNLLDTTSDQTRGQFAQQYGGPGSGSGCNYMNMYDQHRSEGVVAVIGGIPIDAIMALRAFRNVPDLDVLEEIIEELVASDSEEEEDIELDPTCSGGGFNFGPGWPPPDGGAGGGGDGITA